MNIKLIKLVSGEEFIAEITSDANNSTEYLYCKNMVKLGMTERGAMMMPFNPLIPDDETVKFNSEHVMFITNVIPQFIENYKQAFSELALPPAKQLIL
jgi:hypothetical protein